MQSLNWSYWALPIHRQPHLRSSTPELGLYRTTWISTWRGPPVGLLMLCSRSGLSPKQTALLLSQPVERPPEWTAALVQRRRTVTWVRLFKWRQHNSVVKCRNLTRLVNSLQQVDCVITYNHSYQSLTANCMSSWQEAIANE